MQRIHIEPLAFFVTMTYAAVCGSAPAISDLANAVTEAELQASLDEYFEATELSDRRNMPTQEMQDDATELYESAASKGNVFAMHNLAVRYEHGIGIPKDLERAAEWYALSAKLGFAGSQNNLGDMYEKGEGLPQSYVHAIYWYTMAAMQGEPTAYWSLGSLFSQGRGVPKDYVESAIWLELAIAHLPDGSNQKDAANELDSVMKRLNDRQRREVHTRVRLFEPMRQTDITIGDRPN